MRSITREQNMFTLVITVLIINKTKYTFDVLTTENKKRVILILCNRPLIPLQLKAFFYNINDGVCIIFCVKHENHTVAYKRVNPLMLENTLRD